MHGVMKGMISAAQTPVRSSSFQRPTPTHLPTPNTDVHHHIPDWTFFRKYYSIYVRVAVQWGRTSFGMNGPAVNPRGGSQHNGVTVLGGSETDEELVKQLREGGASFLTIADVWHAAVVVSGGFRNKGNLEYRKSRAQRIACWWMASELLQFADTDDAVGSGKVIQLPSYSVPAARASACLASTQPGAAGRASAACRAMLAEMTAEEEALLHTAMYAEPDHGEGVIERLEVSTKPMQNSDSQPDY